jgi:Lrp/AsnC family transcriptional regulator for asnA, asnC and gidA
MATRAPEPVTSIQPDIDDVDRTLIGALIKDGRATYAALAPAVGLSQAAVRTRVQRLLDEQIITVTGRVDPSSLGLGVFTFALLEISEPLEEVAASIGEIDGAVFVVLASGRFDILVELRCSDNDMLLVALDQLRSLPGVRRLQSATVLHYDKQNWTGVGSDSQDVVVAPAPTPNKVLDETDRRLVNELMADGRASYATLGPLVGLSPAAVRDRVLDLLSDGVITIQAHPVPEAMGIGGFAGLLVKAVGPVGPLVKRFVELAETTLVGRTIGRFDLMAEVWFYDYDHLARLLDELRTDASVGALDVVPYLKVSKEDFRTG